MKTVKWNPTSNLAHQILLASKPSRKYQPEWYKKLSAFIERKPTYRADGTVDKTLKHCVPFADSVNAGYIMETWQDIHFEFGDDGSFGYSFPTEPPIIANRDRPAMEMGDDFHSVEFVFHPQWTPELPAGWSMLYVQPLNRPELPFFFPSGIIDSDKFTSANAESSLPFYVKKSFSGILPAGTPMVQMIPIKRESWISSTELYDEKKQRGIAYGIKKHFWGGYKELFWSKKTYK